MLNIKIYQTKKIVDLQTFKIVNTEIHYLNIFGCFLPVLKKCNYCFKMRCECYISSNIIFTFNFYSNQSPPPEISL